MIRLTLDLDKINLTRAKRKYNLVKMMFPLARKYELRRSAGGQGFHVLAYGVYPCSKDGLIDLLADRVFLGDDRRRVISDFLRITDGLPFNILFTHKGEGRAETLITEEN